MMPTFPPIPLSFRTAGFPQYGWKAGFPSGAFPGRQRLRPAPGIRRPASGLHPPFVHLAHNGKTHLALGIAHLFSRPPKLGLARGAHLGRVDPVMSASPLCCGLLRFSTLRSTDSTWVSWPHAIRLPAHPPIGCGASRSVVDGLNVARTVAPEFVRCCPPCISIACRTTETRRSGAAGSLSSFRTPVQPGSGYSICDVLSPGDVAGTAS
jgi:hypothetical protein